MEITFNLNDGLWYFIYQHLAKETGGIQPWQFLLLTSAFVIISIVAGYLLGSINSAIIVSRIFYNDDIRRHGSGNAGLTNILRTYGKGAAGFTLLGDFLKTAIAVAIGGILGGFGYFGGISIGGIPQGTFPLTYIAGLFSIIGHVYPIFYKFKGGKGVLCTAVMALILNPIEFAILLALFIIMLVISKYVSLASVTVAVLYPVVVNGHIAIIKGFMETPPATGILLFITVIIAIMIVYMHRENLKRISNGTERRFSIGHKEKREDSSEEHS